MKNVLTLLICCCLVWSCKKNDDDNTNYNNQYLPNYSFNTGDLINLSLPQYTDLQFPNNYVVLDPPYGINGVVVFYAGGNNYNAFELSDPNHELRDCSSLTVEGVIASCDCDDHDKRYDILTGQPQEGTTGSYGLKRYFVEKTGDIIRVWNN